VGLLLLVAGGACCIAAAFFVIDFASAVADLDAFEAAHRCATPTQDAGANCVSFFNGTITAESSASRFTDVATVAIADSPVEVEVRYNAQQLWQGSSVITEWWKGRLVLIGPAGPPPSITTQDSPQDHVQVFGYGLAVPALALSLLMAGLLIVQAPMSDDALIKASIAKWPDPPRPVDSAVAWRVGLGSNVMMIAFFVWVPLFALSELILGLSGQARYAPWLLLVTFFVAFGLMVPVACLGTLQLIRASARRTIAVQKVARGLGRAGTLTEIWFEVNPGRQQTLFLDQQWDGHVNEGDRLDMLVDATSGDFRRMLSTPSI
jgi:hypothetical protein